MSSVPPDTVRVHIPKAVLWSWLGSMLAAAIAIWLSWLQMHDEVLELKLHLAAVQSEATAAHQLAASVESREDVSERKIQHLEDTRR